MTLLARLLGILLPACGASGAAGLAGPPLMDVARIVRPASPNTALAAPAAFVPAPDIVTPEFRLAPPRLFAVLRRVAAMQPRTYLAAEYAPERQAHWVARSALLNFPDLVTGQVLPAGEGHSGLVIYSRSVYGYSDLGVNRQRLTAWLAAINAAVKQMNGAP